MLNHQRVMALAVLSASFTLGWGDKTHPPLGVEKYPSPALLSQGLDWGGGVVLISPRRCIQSLAPQGLDWGGMVRWGDLPQYPTPAIHPITPAVTYCQSP